MELGTNSISVISNITVQDNITKISIKTCDITTYNCIATTTFEIETNGLRIYNFKVEKNV